MVAFVGCVGWFGAAVVFGLGEFGAFVAIKVWIKWERAQWDIERLGPIWVEIGRQKIRFGVFWKGTLWVKGPNFRCHFDLWGFDRKRIRAISKVKWLYRWCWFLLFGRWLNVRSQWFWELFHFRWHFEASSRYGWCRNFSSPWVCWPIAKWVPWLVPLTSIPFESKCSLPQTPL